VTQPSKTEILVRNVASNVSPPKVKAEEVEILTPEQTADVLPNLSGQLHTVDKGFCLKILLTMAV